MFGEGLTYARRYLDGRLRTRPGSIEKITPGTGAVVRQRGRPCAAYRDDDGTMHLMVISCRRVVLVD